MDAFQLLNAKPENAEREAEIISQSGRIGAVTIATNMAGRGTDIILGGNPDFMARLKLREILMPRCSLHDILFYVLMCARIVSNNDANAMQDE